MKVLVTGGAGNVGSHIVDLLLARPDVERVIAYDNLHSGTTRNLMAAAADPRFGLITADICHFPQLRSYMDGIDIVFHTASLLLLESRERPQTAIDTNIYGTYNVLQACVESGVRKLIFSSSASVFGEPQHLPVGEGHPYNNVTWYGATKIAGEQMCISYCHNYGLDFVALRYYNIYGPRQAPKAAYAQILPRWLSQIATGEPITVYGEGNQTMDMIYVTDVARANILAMDADTTGWPPHDRFFNIGTGRETSVKECLQLLLKIKGIPDYKVEHYPHDHLLVQRRRCAIRKARERLGFVAEVPVETGLNEYIDWWEANH